MQSNKPSKKTRKDVSEPVAASSTEVSAQVEKTAKPRTSKSSPSKSETIETASAKRHRKAATVSTPEPAVQEPVSAPKAMAAAAGSGTTNSIIAKPGPVEGTRAADANADVSQRRLEELAYQFWLADGQPHGNHFEHWLRAERELGLTR